MQSLQNKWYWYSMLISERIHKLDVHERHENLIYMGTDDQTLATISMNRRFFLIIENQTE